MEFVDIYPTVAELGGLRGPDILEGQSFVPLLDKPDRTWKSAAFTQMYGPKDLVGRSVVDDRYRYMRWTGPYPGEELYDHKAMPERGDGCNGSSMRVGAPRVRRADVSRYRWVHSSSISSPPAACVSM